MKQPALPEVVMQLIEKLSKLYESLLDHPLNEIRERAMKALALKLQGQLVPIIDLITKCPQIVSNVLLWINENQKTASPEALSDAIQILKAFIEDEEGRQIECRFGCVEFFSEYRKFAPPFLTADIDTVISGLLRTRRNMVIPESQPTPSRTPVKQSAKKSPEKPFPPKKEEPNIEDEPCEFPMVPLSEAEEKIIFDINVVVRYGDPSAVIRACEDLKGVIEDFPIECLLQRGDLLKNLLHRLENEKDFPFHRFAVPILMKIIDKLEVAYRIYEAKFSRPSELPTLEKVEHKIARAYLEGTYPAVYTRDYAKDQDLVGKVSIDSMSHLCALRRIVKGSIRTMKDTKKLGSVMLLYRKALKAVSANYKLPEERLCKEFFIPACYSFVDTIQSYEIANLLQNALTSVTLQAAVHLLEYMDAGTIKSCRKQVPKFFSALEEAVYFDVFEEKQLETVRKAMEVCNPDIIKVLAKVDHIKEAVVSTKKYQQEKKAAALLAREDLESSEELHGALIYLNQLIACLEFYPVQESFLEEIMIKLIKALDWNSSQINPEDLVNVFVQIMKSPHIEHKTKLLKSIVILVKHMIASRS